MNRKEKQKMKIKVCKVKKGVEINEEYYLKTACGTPTHVIFEIKSKKKQ